MSSIRVSSSFGAAATGGLARAFARRALLAGLVSCLPGCGADVRRTHFADGAPWSEIRFEHGRPNGACTTWHSSGAKARAGAYANGHLDGTWRAWSADGTLLAQDDYRRGRAHGASCAWYPNGREKHRGAFEDGRASGPWLEFFENGVLAMQGQYVAGAKHGEWQTWNRDGKPHGGARFEHGTFVRKLPGRAPP